MTGILSNQLPGRANPPDADNPLGSFKDRTAPGANDGSYLTQTWANDRNSLLQALFIASGLTPNGVEDTGTASQLFDALVNNRWSSIGNYEPGSIVVGSDGNEYKCISSNGRDSTVTDPTTVTDRSVWVRYPFESGFNSNGDYKVHHDGEIEQWINTPVFSGSSATFTLPYELPDTNNVYAMATHDGTSVKYYGTSTITSTTQITINSSETSANKATIYLKRRA